MNKEKIKKIETKVTSKIESKIYNLHVFDEPRPHYISKITVSDKILKVTFLKLFPRFVRPNFLTVFRFVSVPFVIFFLMHKDYEIGFWLFAISVFTDALDGAMARTRNQITNWGIVFDPLADKLLIGSTALILISKFINPQLAWVIVLIEIFLILSAYIRFKGEIVPARIVGKIKMVFQSVGVCILFLGVIFSLPILISIATYVLYTAIFLALLSLFVYRSI